MPKKLQKKLEVRMQQRALRGLKTIAFEIDFSSNDYLGLAKDKQLFDAVHRALLEKDLAQNGAGGSRLLTGNSSFVEALEAQIATWHKCESALLYHSGYAANLGFCQAVFQRGDVVLYDAYCHASIRDGIQLSNAKSFKFRHNSLDSLRKGLKKYAELGAGKQQLYVFTESVFSMDGDAPDLKGIAKLCEEYNALLIIDEAHGIGVSPTGLGWVHDLELQNQVFATVVTYGKALGCGGAAILGGKVLRKYLINFSRSFIYTTATSNHAIMTIKLSYLKMMEGTLRKQLLENILYFKHEMERMGLVSLFIPSNSAIQACVIPGNDQVKQLANILGKSQLDVRPILSPTVSVGEERLRICIHAYNTQSEMALLLEKINLWQQKSPKSIGC